MPMMFRINPFPEGKRFAVTFVDDTDLSTRANTEPVYHFLLANQFFGTKTVWALEPRRTSSFRQEEERPFTGPSPGSSLEDKDYLEFILRLQEAGFEIGLHGVSAGNSTRAEILEGLDRFRLLMGHDPVINAFHQTNIENLYGGAGKLDSRFLRLIEALTDRSDYKGHVEGSPYFWGDVARETFRYVRLPFHTIEEVSTLRVSPQMPFHDPRRPFVRRWFVGSDGANVHRFNRLLNAQNIDRLDQEQGACIVYTHLAKGFAGTHRGEGQLEPGFVKTVENLVGRSGAWLPTASELLDRLAAVGSITLVHAGFLVTVENTGDQALTRATLMTGPGVELLDDCDRPLARASDRAVVLPPLRPGESLRFRSSRAGSSRIEAHSSLPITRRQHRAIEYHNYYGLVRSAIIDRLQRTLKA